MTAASRTRRKSRARGHGVHSRRDRSVTFPQTVDNFASSLDEQDIYENLASRATHESTGGNEDFNSLYLFYALAPKQSLHFILHTALLGTITSIMSIIVTIYLCQHFEHSLLLIVIKNDYTYMTIWFVTSIYLQVFSFIQRLVVVKKVLQILNDRGQEVDTMRIEDSKNEYYYGKRKELMASFYFKFNKMTGKARFLVNCFNFLYFPLHVVHYNSIENPMDKAMIQLFGSQLIIFAVQLAFLFVGFFYWTWIGILERRQFVNARQTASIDNTLAPNIGTPPELIKALPSQKYVRCKKLNDKIPEKCVICLERYSSKSRVSCLPCSDQHVYHTKCLHTWLRKSTKCPLCNVDCAHSLREQAAIK